MTNTFKRDFHNDYDLNDPELNERWDELIPHMHSGCPVARSEVGEKYWVLNRYKDVFNATRDWETFSAAAGFMVNRPADLPYSKPGECDPPFHDRLRNVLMPYLRPKSVAPLEEKIRYHANKLIDGFIEDGSVELVEAFCNPLPAMVFAVEMAGMDPADMPFMFKVFNLTGPSEERAKNFALGRAKLDTFLRMRKDSPKRGDFVDALLEFEHPDYSWEDKVGTLSQMLIGGIGTSGFAISGGIHHLATHPEDRQTLIDKPEQIPRAIEEFLRMFCGAPNMGRRIAKAIEIDGKKLEPGDRVVLSYGTANRDPEVWENADKIDINRDHNRHLAFGGGVHTCLGSPLARLDLRVAYEQLLKRLPDMSVPAGFKPRYETANVRHMIELPLLFTPGKRLNGASE